ncbi:reverse transcriptase domain-containing protein [Tanacetum coccineum]
MPTWCHMFNSTLTRNERVWFDDLPQEYIDSYDDLKKAFLENYLQQKKCIKDPVEIHNIKQRDGESMEEFVWRYKLECRDVKGAPECMKISGFMHRITNPELIKRLHDQIPKSVDEMMRVTTAFLRGKVAASSRERKKSFPSWKQQEAGQKQNFKKGGFRNQKRPERKQNIFTLLTTTPKEILALDKGKFKPPPPMTTPIEKRNIANSVSSIGNIRMEQYLTFTDHALWELRVNGDQVSPIASASTGAEGPIPPKTAKQKLARKNELKAKSTLMLAIPDEHLLKFHACKDAKSLWEAIKNRFGGKKKSKKMQKTILKQNYENFAASSQEGLIKPMIDNSSSTNETVNTAHSVSAASSKDQASTASYANDVMFSFFVNQSNALQLDYEDLEHIDADDLEEMDLKWQVAIMRVKRFIKKTGRKMDLNDKETVRFDRKKVECYNCHRICHFARECRAPRN